MSRIKEILEEEDEVYMNGRSKERSVQPTWVKYWFLAFITPILLVILGVSLEMNYSDIIKTLDRLEGHLNKIDDGFHSLNDRVIHLEDKK